MGLQEKGDRLRLAQRLFRNSTDDFNLAMVRVIAAKGIRYWKRAWPTVDRIDICGGVACMSSVEMAPWNAYDIDPDRLPFTFENPQTRRCPDICCHWPNYLRYDPENNFERVGKWKNYFCRFTSPFGMMLAHDVCEAASQSFYSKYATVDTADGGYRIDLSPADAVGADLMQGHFYVCLKNGEAPKTCLGGKIELYEEREDNTLYKIERDKGASVINIKLS